MIINTKNLSIDLAGEVLREFVFGAGEQKWDYIPKGNWTQANATLPEDVLDILSTDLDAIVKRNGNGLTVFVQYDGDTILGFVDNEAGKIIYNSDAKKSYGWREIKL